MNAVMKRYHDVVMGTDPMCHYCTALKFNSTEGKHCTHCGAANPDYDPIAQEDDFGDDCANNHEALKEAVTSGSQLCVEAPFCEDCGFCGLLITWREHVRPLEDRTSYELVKDNKQVAYIYLWLTEGGLLNHNLMKLNLQDEALSFDELYVLIENAPNLPDDVRELMMASKGRWDVKSGPQAVIVFKQ